MGFPNNMSKLGMFDPSQGYAGYEFNRGIDSQDQGGQSQGGLMDNIFGEGYSPFQKIGGVANMASGLFDSYMG